MVYSVLITVAMTGDNFLSVDFSKTFQISTKQAGVNARVIRFIGSNESIDRDGDTIAVDGWDVSDYMKNPIVLYGHDSGSLPVAKTTNITIDTRSRALLFDIAFPTIEDLSTNPATPSDHALRVDAIYNMAKAGILNAVSVGFKGIDYEPSATGRNYKKQKLYEISIVPIPANPEAVAVLRSAGISDLTIKGVMPMETKAGARLSAASKEKLNYFRNKCNDLVKEMDEFMSDPNVNEEEGTNASPPELPKSAKADNIVITLIDKPSSAKEEK
jgi:HK97 family phage prohead protease